MLMCRSSRMDKFAERKLMCMLQNLKRRVAVPILGKEYHDTFGHEFPCKELGFASLEEYLKKCNEVSCDWSEKSKFYFVSYKTQCSSVNYQSKKPRSETSCRGRSYCHTRSKQSLLGEYRKLNQIKNSLIHLVKNQNNGLTIPELNMLYEEKTGQKLNLYDHGFNTLFEFVDTIDELIIITKNGTDEVFWAPSPHSSDHSNSAMEKHKKQGIGYIENTMWSDDASDSSSCVSPGILDKHSAKSRESSATESHINETVKNFFRAILKNHPEGVWASQFCQKYKELTGHYFEMQSIGYYNFITLVEDHPSIFAWRDIAFSSGDFLLFDAETFEETKQKLLQGDTFDKLYPEEKLKAVISNIKDLVSFCEEGISLDEFFHVYKLNFGQVFNLEEFGYQSLKAFLDSIAGEVPLCLVSASKVTKIYGFHSETPGGVTERIRYPIPLDTVIGDAKYEPQWIPTGVKSNSYTYVYIASFFHPDHFYIQFDDGSAKGVLKHLMDDLQSFYCSDEGELYRMQEVHIKTNAICVGLYDNELWHRIEILEVFPLYVEVFFVDYGSVGDVNKEDLRYLRKQFHDIPSQAVKARLADIKPCGVKWPSNLQDQFIEMVADKRLCAFLSECIVQERILYIYLWETDPKGIQSYSINDILVYKAYASYCDDAAEPTESILKSAWHNILKDQDYKGKSIDVTGTTCSEIVDLSASFNELSFDAKSSYRQKGTSFHADEITSSPTAQNQYNNKQREKDMTRSSKSRVISAINALNQNNGNILPEHSGISDKVLKLSTLKKAPDASVNESSQKTDLLYSFVRTSNQKRGCYTNSVVNSTDKMHVGHAFENASHHAEIKFQNSSQNVLSADSSILSQAYQKTSVCAKQFSSVEKTSKSVSHVELSASTNYCDKTENMCDFILPPQPPRNFHSTNMNADISSSVLSCHFNGYSDRGSPSTCSTHSLNNSWSSCNIFPTSPSLSSSSSNCDFTSCDGSMSPVSREKVPVLTRSSSKRNEPEVYNEMYECPHEKFFRKNLLKSGQNVKRLFLNDYSMVHIIKLMDKPYISCHDLAQIIVGCGNVKLLMEKAAEKNMCRYPIKVYKTNDEELFGEIKRYGVKEISQKVIDGEHIPVLCVFPVRLAIEYIFAFGVCPEEIIQSMRYAMVIPDVDGH